MVADRWRCHADLALSNTRRLQPIRYFPAFLDLAGRAVLVLGDGEVAERKALPLTRAGARVTRATKFDPGQLAGCALAVGADAPEAELQALSQAAQAAGIPVNVVDRPELCSFITPAIVDRDPITIAISSGGAAPVLARDVRARIEALLPPALGRLATLLDGLKAELRRSFPDVAARRRSIDRILAGPAAELALAGRDAEAREAALACLTAPGPQSGVVHLVGAGPGAADLLTLRAHRLLGQADVIVHDRLVSEAVLDMARRDAERICVGKSRAAHSVTQEAIGALLVRLANKGRRVVRLKGGDPSVFGRIAEEAACLAAAGIAFEIVPGVTAAAAAAAQARLALTARDTARCVTLVSAHLTDGRLDLDCAALARLGGTLAVYMGSDSLPLLCDGLLAGGYAASAPATLVEHAGTDRQRTLRATLGSIAEQAPGWLGDGPVLALVGPGLLGDPAAVDGQRHAGDGAGGLGA